MVYSFKDLRRLQITTTYSQLSEDEKEKRRVAVRKFAAKNNRTEYYKEYELKRIRDPRTVMYNNSTGNARRKNLEHSIEKEDIIISDTCPCCKEPMTQPSLDRVNNNKGYIKSNIKVICWPCNKAKETGDAELHRKIADYIDAFTQSA